MRLLRELDSEGDPGAAFLQGTFYERRKKWREAETAYERARERGFVPASHKIAHLRERVGDFAGARPFLEEGVRGGDFESAIHLANIDRISVAGFVESLLVSAAIAGRVQAALVVGDICRERGDFRESCRWFETAAAVAASEGGNLPKDVNIVIGHSYENAGDRGKAEFWYRRALDADDRRAGILLGLLLETDGRTAEAEQFLEIGAELSQAAAVRLAKIRFDRNNLQPSIDVLQRSAYRKLQGACHSLAMLLEYAGRNAEAEEWFRIDVSRGNYHSFAHLALLRLRAGDRSGADRFLMKAKARTHPHDRLVYMVRWFFYLTKDRDWILRLSNRAIRTRILRARQLRSIMNESTRGDQFMARLSDRLPLDVEPEEFFVSKAAVT